MNTYMTNGVCSQAIQFEIKDGKVHHVTFIGGCHGNTQGIAKLVEGMDVHEVISKLEGTDCSGRGTSCPDQLARALRAAL